MSLLSVNQAHFAQKALTKTVRSNEERLLKILIGDLALTSMGLGDKAAAFKLIERPMAVILIEKDAVTGPTAIEILARVAAGTGEPDRAIAALQKLLSIPYVAPLALRPPLTPALLRLDPMFDCAWHDQRSSDTGRSDRSISQVMAQRRSHRAIVCIYDDSGQDD